jgi:predicted RNA binding protein YcfA (HicA-like mRNA interferase family)
MPDAPILTYARLYQLLHELGFEDESVKSSHRVFRHAASNTIVAQAIHAAAEPVNLVDLKSTRRILDEKGLLPAAEFDQFATASPRPSAAS